MEFEKAEELVQLGVKIADGGSERVRPRSQVVAVRTLG